MGEGLSLPLGGADAVWNRLKLVLDRKVEEVRHRGGARRPREAVQHAGERRQAAERKEKVVDAIRWAWKVMGRLFLYFCFLLFVLSFVVDVRV